MSEKWKFKLKTGLIWGVFMAVVMTGIEALEKHTFEVYISWKFVAQLLIFTVCGVFILGHFNWKAKEKTVAENKKA